MSKIKQKLNKDTRRIKGRESTSVSTNATIPIFSFEFMRDNHHCTDCCINDDLIALIKKIRTLSKITWNEILSSPRHGLGCEKICLNSIKESIPEEISSRDDINFISIRFNGKKPMIGFREDRTFNIIWIDHDFKVYNH